MLSSATTARRGGSRSWPRTTLTLQGPLAKEPALLRLAMLRGDLETLEQLLAVNPKSTSSTSTIRLRASTGWRTVDDRGGVEAEAPRALDVGGYVEPFAMRALGKVRTARRSDATVAGDS